MKGGERKGGGGWEGKRRGSDKNKANGTNGPTERQKQTYNQNERKKRETERKT